MSVPGMHVRPDRASMVALGLLLSLPAGCASVVSPPSELPVTMQRHIGEPGGIAAADAGIAIGVPARQWWVSLDDSMRPKGRAAFCHGGRGV